MAPNSDGDTAKAHDVRAQAEQPHADIGDQHAERQSDDWRKARFAGAGGACDLTDTPLKSSRGLGEHHPGIAVVGDTGRFVV